MPHYTSKYLSQSSNVYSNFNHVIHNYLITKIWQDLYFHHETNKTVTFFQEEPCFNKGTCIDGINSYSCNCTDTGFEGQHCEINIDECMTNPCQNNAECNDLVNDYKCDCHPGYDGTCARPIEVSPFYESPLQITQV